MLKKSNMKTHTYTAGTYTDEHGIERDWYVDIREDFLFGHPTWTISYRINGIGFTYEPWGLTRDENMPLKKVLGIVEKNMETDKLLFLEELEFSEWCTEHLCFDLPNKIANPIVFENE